jgi:hypothetical protein
MKRGRRRGGGEGEGVIGRRGEEGERRSEQRGEEWRRGAYRDGCIAVQYAATGCLLHVHNEG